MKKLVKLTLVLTLALTIVSCSDTDVPTTGELTLDLTGLETLGDDYVYEGWLIVNDAPISTGTFSSVTFPQKFVVDTENLEAATKFVLSIEPAGETGTAAAEPSKTKLLAGDFSGDAASVSSVGIVGDFSPSKISGKYILATPTTTDMTDETSGVWFLDNTSTPPTPGLSLPDLAEGWKYEGWAVIGGIPVSTGVFTNVAATDESDIYSGPIDLPAPNGADGFFPGEDFIMNAPQGLVFPTDLKGATIVVSIEPSPDNSPAPFTLKPLAHVVPSPAVDHVVLTMGAGPVAALTGSVSR